MVLNRPLDACICGSHDPGDQTACGPIDRTWGCTAGGARATYLTQASPTVALPAPPLTQFAATCMPTTAVAAPARATRSSPPIGALQPHSYHIAVPMSVTMASALRPPMRQPLPCITLRSGKRFSSRKPFKHNSGFLKPRTVSLGLCSAQEVRFLGFRKAMNANAARSVGQGCSRTHRAGRAACLDHTRCAAAAPPPTPNPLNTPCLHGCALPARIDSTYRLPVIL